MPYQKTTWADRQVSRPLTFTMTNNADGTVTLTPAEGTIIASGTPITAANLNNMETGIANALPMSEGGTVQGAVKMNAGTVVAAVQGLKFDAARAAQSQILWNASAASDYGMVFNVDGVSVLVLTSDRKVTANGNVLVKNAANGYYMVITEEKIENPTGTGNLTVKSADTGGNVVLHCPAAEIQTKSNGLRVCNPAFSAYVPVYASAFTNMSKRDLKKNIEDYTGSGEDIVNSATLREYHYKSELDQELKHVGLIYEEAPVEVIDLQGNGVDVYAMTSVAWKAIQELSGKLAAMEKQNADLEARLARLEEAAV
ncbi:tail fiber domain-containing protein [Ectobacillus ponti]|uniref:Tail fiber domain-containing protein n=1 Tax=Ectobacillus ponti TaxID=2961894 RepID=A0AA42BPZ2_9BACI|nr:tail fiber domain-containing protein [Ectobacillus ponti]MCP8969730.1 tail fiber domain-containing protein [Ectobacillus ponti]